VVGKFLRKARPNHFVGQGLSGVDLGEAGLDLADNRSS